MTRNNTNNTILLIICAGFLLAGADVNDTLTLPYVESYLNGILMKRQAGACDSTELSIVFYSTPSNKDLAGNAWDRLYSAKNHMENIRSYFIVNKAGAIIPDVFLKTMLKRKSGKNPETVYGIDKNQNLTKAWKIEPPAALIIVIDHFAEVKFRSSLPLKENEYKRLKTIFGNVN